MNDTSANLILFSIFFVLIGFLLGASISETGLRVSDASSIIIATAACYGVFKWRAQHDYQERIKDRKAVVKKIKTSTSYAIQLEILYDSLASALTKHHKQKSEFTKHIVTKNLNSIESINEKIEKTLIELESEVATNLTIEKNEILQKSVYRLIHALQDVFYRSSATLTAYQRFDLINQSEDSDYSTVKYNSTEKFKKFAAELRTVEKMLDIQDSSVARIESFRELRKSQSSEKGL